ncbi:eotaxin-like [Huso huso]|uniref:Eotaxin-like n=2 Tax=Acipenseridae TaxID=7900 RepID=A0AAD8DI79_ACIOX|nr:eotaxin-like [Acipenser oxyrinchus oxyrinchus]
MNCNWSKRLFWTAVILIILGNVTLVGGNYRRPSKVTTNCCTSVSIAKVSYKITRFKEQNALKPCVKAVIFYTDEVGPFCADPRARWVRSKVNELRKAAAPTKT